MASAHPSRASRDGRPDNGSPRVIKAPSISRKKPGVNPDDDGSRLDIGDLLAVITFEPERGQEVFEAQQQGHVIG